MFCREGQRPAKDYEEEPGRRSAAKLLSKDQARSSSRASLNRDHHVSWLVFNALLHELGMVCLNGEVGSWLRQRSCWRADPTARS